MYCANCGHQMREGARFCPNCGKQVLRAAGASQPASPQQARVQQSVATAVPEGTERVVASQAQQSAALVEASGVQSAHQEVMNPYQVADIFAQVSMDKQNLQACEEELALLEQRRLRLIIWTVVCALIGPMLVAQIFPPCSSIIFFTIDSPIPLPPLEEFREASVR